MAVEKLTIKYKAQE